MEKRTRYIYRITNLAIGKTYIGQHTVRLGKTIESDTYWGSGKLLKDSIKKYGLENFKKEIIISGEFTKAEINELEIKWIKLERGIGKAEYNISDGGESPFTNVDFAREVAIKTNTKEKRERISLKMKQLWNEMTEEEKQDRIKKGLDTKTKRGFDPGASWRGKSHTKEQLEKMSEKAKFRTGSKNSSFGKVWWTNGENNVKSEDCPTGYWKGRVVNPDAKCHQPKPKKLRVYFVCIETGEKHTYREWYKLGYKDVVNASKKGTCKGCHFTRIEELE